MKKIVILFTLCCSHLVFGQETLLERQAAKTKEKIKQRAENRVEQGIDKTLDKTEEEIENGLKDGKKKKTEKDAETDAPLSGKEQSGTQQDGETSAKANSTPKSAGNPELKAYSKFDFIPGEKVIAYEDFSQDAIGDFPHQWNTNSSGEIVTIESQTGHWMQFAPKGIFYPEFINELPENFTLEMEMAASTEFSEMQGGLSIFFPEMGVRNLQFDNYFSSDPQAGVDIHPHGESGTSSVWVFGKSGEQLMSNEASMSPGWKIGDVNKISIWKQKSRLRVYINEVKIWDIPRAFLVDLKYSILFATNIFEGTVYISNMRLAEGAADTRNKLLTEGKLVSRGILFDINSDRLKPESYGALQEIAKVLKEAPDVKVRIVGHTDSDGDELANVELSKKRALVVKQVLISEFKIEASRMETDGKGESEPSDSNATAVGKANNRRVEFLKIE
jgi:outer membrane protein OmpA-like peptidoglycan-associated protein